jgi:hypothetical protein
MISSVPTTLGEGDENEIEIIDTLEGQEHFGEWNSS